MKIYTINSDASVDSHSETAAYAYYIKGDDRFLRASGVLERKTNSSSVAELLAFEKAIRRLDDTLQDDEDVTVYLNTDSMWVINALTGAKMKTVHRPLIKAVLWSTRHYRIIPRHIKAHTTATDIRSWVNRWCDQAARQALRTELGK